MCLLLVFHRVRADAPCVLAANRHEALERPADVPRIHSDRVKWMGPIDLQAGGTWIGINEFGLIAAITNGPSSRASILGPSRGLLCREALQQPSLAAGLNRVRELAGSTSHQPFQLMLADRERCLIIANANEGGFQETWLAPGVHVLTNRHGINEWWPDHLTGLRSVVEHAEVVEIFDALGDFCRIHDAVGAPAFAPCQHRDGYGTRSSLLLLLHADDREPPRVVYAGDAPCRSPYRMAPTLEFTV